MSQDCSDDEANDAVDDERGSLHAADESTARSENGPACD